MNAQQTRRPEGRVDIHFHLLPGIDDGPTTLDESVDLAVQAALDGTRTIVATPHVRSDFLTDLHVLPEIVREVRCRLAREGVEMTVLCGAELGHDMVGRLGQDQFELIAQGPLGSRWLLVETPWEGITEEFAGATAELRARGFACVLAHPERGAGVLDEDCLALRHELHSGGLLQINGSSLAGWHGNDAREAGFELASRMSAVVASDAHGATRPPALSVAHELAVMRGLGGIVARDLVEVGPRSLLRGGIQLPLPAAA